MKDEEFNLNDLAGLFELLKSSASLATTSRDGTITYANEKFCSLMGYKVEEIVGNNPRIFNSGIHEINFFKNLWNTVLRGQVWHGQICNRKKDGHFIWLDTFIGPVFDKSGKIEKFILVRFDVTTGHEQELLVKSQSAQLTSSAKMVALGEMAAGMAHEINNPLAVISARTASIGRQLQSGRIDFDKMAKDLEKIQKTTQRISKIVLALRQFSRNAENDSMLPINISNLLEDTLALCGEKFKNHGITLKVNNEVSSEVQISGRFTQLSQVLIILLNNAYDAVESLTEKWVDLSVSKVNELVVIKVTDSGHGIPEDIASKLMQPFFTTKEIGKGTGLGLSIARGVVQDHQGKIYYNRYSDRTQFIVEIPIEASIRN